MKFIEITHNEFTDTHDSIPNGYDLIVVEKSDIDIENIVNLVEEGNTLSKLCDDKLKAIEKQISVIEK